MHLYLILYDYLSATGVENLNKTSETFSHFDKILSYAEPNTVFKLFQDNPDYASQTSIPTERILQLLFLAVTRTLYVPSITRSLAENYTMSCRNLETILQGCKDALPPDMLTQLKRFLNHHNPIKFVCHITVEQSRQARACGNHASVENNIPKVEYALNKEERNKCASVFPCWLEQLFPDLHLAPQGLTCEEGKSD